MAELEPEASRTVGQLLDERAAATPHAVAFRRESPDGHWVAITWRDFAERVDVLRRGLLAAGLTSGDRFAIIAPVSLEWELLHHAALAMGAVVVGLDAHDLPQRIATMVEQADVKAFAVLSRGVLSSLDAERWRDVRFVIELAPASGSTPEGAQSTRWLAWSQFEAHGVVSAASAPGPGADDLATIIFTSGTTGAPKGIAYNHAQVCQAIAAICDAFDFVGHDSRLLCWLPLSNLFQRIVNLAGMRRGACTSLLGDPRRVMQVVAQVAPDIFIGVPRFYEKLHQGILTTVAAQPPWRRALLGWAWDVGRRANRLRRERRPLPWRLAIVHSIADAVALGRVRSLMGARLKCMVSGSAPMSLNLLEDFHGLGWLVLEAYGLSENIVPMAMNRPDDFRFGTVGRPLKGNDIVVGDDGGIRVRGAGLFGGYLGDEGRSPLDAKGFYRTGDLGEITADGFLRLTGRSSEIIKTSTGRRVAPVSVESQLSRVEGIDQVVLVGDGRKCLVALCTCVDGTAAGDARAELVAALRGRVALISEHERPLGIALLDRAFSIERDELTPNLKLRRKAIEAQHANLISRLYASIDQRENSGERDIVIV